MTQTTPNKFGEWIASNLWWMLTLGAFLWMGMGLYFQIKACGISGLFVRCVEVAHGN